MELIKELKYSKIAKSVFVVLIGTILLAASSKIKIPFYPVPMTMQTLVILFLGITLGWKLGLATVALYLFEGIIGLPVFSGSPEKGIFIFDEIAKRIVPINAINTFFIILDCFTSFINSIFIYLLFF